MNLSPELESSRLWLAAVALGCWLLMFAAGTDVWHDTGRLDLWNLEGPPYADLRVCVVTFYVLLPVLVVQCATALISVLRQRTASRT